MDKAEENIFRLVILPVISTESPFDPKIRVRFLGLSATEGDSLSGSLFE